MQTISEAMSLLSTRIDTLWTKVVDLANTTGTRLQYLYDLWAALKALVESLTFKVTSVETNNVTQDGIISDHQNRIEVLESSLGIIPTLQVQKGNYLLAADTLLDTLNVNGIIPEADGGYLASDVLLAAQMIYGATSEVGQYSLVVTSGVLPISGATVSTIDSNDQLVIETDLSVTLYKYVGEVATQVGLVTITPEPTTDPVTELEDGLSQWVGFPV